MIYLALALLFLGSVAVLRELYLDDERERRMAQGRPVKGKK